MEKKIKYAHRSVCWMVDVIEEDGTLVTYRTNGRGQWERLYGESWEPEYSLEDSLTEMFKDYLEETGIV